MASAVRILAGGLRGAVLGQKEPVAVKARLLLERGLAARRTEEVGSALMLCLIPHITCWNLPAAHWVAN